MDNLKIAAISIKERFRNSYGYINEKSLGRAALMDPELLIKLVEDESLSVQALDAAIVAMGDSRNPVFLPHILRFVNHRHPSVRDSVVTALEDYVEDGIETDLIKEYISK